MRGVEELREEAMRQIEQREKRHTDKQKAMLVAHQALVLVLEKSISTAISNEFKRNINATKTRVYNPHKGGDMRLVRGYFNKVTKTYSRKYSDFGAIELDPISELLEKLRPFGVTSIRDVSDPNLSFNFVLEVEWSLDKVPGKAEK